MTVAELVERQALLARVGVARDDEYFEALIPERDRNGSLLWLKPSGERTR